MHLASDWPRLLRQTGSGPTIMPLWTEPGLPGNYVPYRFIIVKLSPPTTSQQKHSHRFFFQQWMDNVVCRNVLYSLLPSSSSSLHLFLLHAAKKQTWKGGRPTKEESSWGRMWRQDEVMKDTGGKLLKGIYTLSWVKGQTRSWTNKHVTSSETGRQSQMAVPDRLQSGEKMKKKPTKSRLVSDSDWREGVTVMRKLWFWTESNNWWERTGCLMSHGCIAWLHFDNPVNNP